MSIRAFARHALVLAPLSLTLILASCKGESSKPKESASSKPKLTKEQIPTELEGLMLGVSTEEDIAAKLPGLEVSKDEATFGGKGGVVKYNDTPAIVMRSPRGKVPRTELWLVDMKGTPRLVKFELIKPGGCAWVKEKVGATEGVDRCLTNRKLSEGSLLYCLQSSDGEGEIQVNCDKHQENDGITYSLSGATKH